MKNPSVLILAMLALILPGTLHAQVEGLRIEGGVVFLTQAGSFTFGPSEVESDAGYAFRARVRYGFGFLSVAAEFQESSQSYGSPPSASAPQNLNTSFVGATAAVHPFKFAGVVPYAEIGIGKLFFGDQSISTDQGSTAAVYGNPQGTPILEEFPIQAVNAYGESKVMVETLLGWFDQLHHLTSVCLRYFNASGCDPEGGLGEEHEPETHLLPLVLRAVQTGQPITVFGDDYTTPDGTCIRDYIHVNDLAQAHILAVEHLINGGASEKFNVGTGTGHSVMEMIRTVEAVTGKKVPYVVGPRREGDPPSLVASSRKLRDQLGWAPRYEDLRTIVQHAWNFSNRA